MKRRRRWRRERMTKRRQQGGWNPRCVIPLSTWTAESAAAEAPAALIALSTAWCHTHTHTHRGGGYVHTLMKLPDVYGFVLVVSRRPQEGALHLDNLLAKKK